MIYLNGFLNRVFDLVLSPLVGLGPWIGMIGLCLLTSVLVLLVFKVTSDQAAIARERNRGVARVLELLLYRDDIVVSLGAVSRVLSANGRYMLHLLVPFGVTIVPVFLVLVQASSFFGYRPLQQGEQAVLTARFDSRVDVVNTPVSLVSSPSVRIQTPPVRMPSEHAVSWRIQAIGAEAWADLNVDGQAIRKRISVGPGSRRVAPRRVRAGFLNELLNPTERPLPSNSSVQCVEISYAPAFFRLGSSRLHWLAVFLVLTLFLGLLVKRPLGVEF